MPHINEEQISAYTDGQLSSDERLALEAHFLECQNCRTVRDEFLEVSDFFRKPERFEPSPYLWNRIAADFNRAKSTNHSRIASFIPSLGRHSWNLRFVSATLAVLVVAGFVVIRWDEGRLADRAALADIDRTYRSLAALDPDTYNPFGSGMPQEMDANPFKSLRLSGEKPGILKRSRGTD